VTDDLGRVPPAPGSHASHHAPSGHGPSGFDPSRVDPQTYAQGLLTEEAGEILQALGKAARFGIDAPSPERAPYFSATARQMLETECGDMLAAIEWATYAGLIRFSAVDGQRSRKLAKLFSPDSRDNLGRRLAPEVLHRDRDASLAEDAKRLSPEGVAARPEGIARTPSGSPT